MGTLYELTGDYEAILNMLYDGETDEEVILDTLESIEGEIEDKADNYAKLIKSLKADADKIKEEEQRLYARRKTLENKASVLKDRLEENLRFIGKTKFKTTLFSFNIQKNGGKQPLTITENISDIPMKFIVQPDPVPNNEAIREYLKEHEVEWAHFEPYGESLRIR